MDEFALEQIAELHAVDTGLFVPFVIHRLAATPAAQDAVLDVELRQVPGQPDGRRQLRLHWQAASAPTLPLAIPDGTVTEFAALGVASALIWQYGGFRLSSVSMRGDRFDYWVRRDEDEFGLEVSGTVTDDLAGRHREKVVQLGENPFAAAGFVVVVGFTNRRAIFSYHRPGGGTT